MPRCTNTPPNSLRCLNDTHGEYAFCKRCLFSQEYPGDVRKIGESDAQFEKRKKVNAKMRRYYANHKATPSAEANPVVAQAQPVEPVMVNRVIQSESKKIDEFLKTLNQMEAKGLLALGMEQEIADGVKIEKQKEEIIALKLRIKKLEEDVTYYEEKFKDWDHDTDVLIKALSEIRKTTDKIFTSAV